jgi:hypothetical protein
VLGCVVPSVIPTLRDEGDVSRADEFLGGDIPTEDVLHVVLHSIGAEVAGLANLVEEGQNRADVYRGFLAVEAGSVVSLPDIEAPVVAETALVRVLHCL